MLSEKYLDAAIKNVEEELVKYELKFPTICGTPLSSNYHPYEYTTPELDVSGVQYFQEIIGVFRWVVELGRAEILLEVALLSTHLAFPLEGRLQQVYRIFGYFNKSLYGSRSPAY